MTRLLDETPFTFQSRAYLAHRVVEGLGQDTQRRSPFAGLARGGEGEGIERERVRELEVPAGEPSVFLGLQGPDSFWLGGLADLPANQPLIDALKPPDEETMELLRAAGYVDDDEG